MMQPVTAMKLHMSVASSQVSAVQLIASSQRTPVPAQVPVPFQRSVGVQNIPSSQAVPAGASGLLQTPAVQTSLEQASLSTHELQAPPRTPQNIALVPLRQVVPS